MPVVRLDAQIQWIARPSTTSNRWIGQCAPMNLVMEASSLDELHSLIEEAMQLLLTDLLADNELDRFLKDRGWAAFKQGAITSPSDVKFEVPWELIAKDRMGDPERRAH